MNVGLSASKTPATRTGLVLAATMSLALLALSFARLALDMGGSAFNLDLARSALEVPIWRSRLGLNVATFVLAVAGLHLAMGLVCWAMARLSEVALPTIRCTRRDWIIIWSLVAVAWVLIANATWFPRSALGEPYHRLAATRFQGISPLHGATAVVLGSALTIILLAVRRSASLRKILIVGGAAGIAVMAGLAAGGLAPTEGSQDRPHVIILGIDSLRPDAVNHSLTPNLNGFMEGAVRMSDAITPLARTFPSWASILSGRHPHTTGAYMNLLPREMVHIGTTVPDALRRQGYKSWYAIDETRFSNIDATYGFDRTITPRMGGSDFLLTRITDTPLSNLVVNTRLGALLFPHTHTNRAASAVYDPDAFVHRLGRELEFRHPAFIAVHLTLPHWPFTWATSETDEYESTPVELYTESVRRADTQFGDLIALLDQKGALDNALVIALSDHGEALGGPDEFRADAFPATDRELTDFQRWGHGTSVFSPQQYQVVLAFRAYGRATDLLGPATTRREPVSLLDVAPTILDLLQLKSTENFDGISLSGLLKPDATGAPDLRNRIRFTESEYNPQGFDPRQFSTSQLKDAARIYRLDPVTDLIAVRPDALASILSSRQYAAILGNHAMVAAIPGMSEGGGHQLVSVPFTSPTPDSAEATDDFAMLGAALKARFSIEVGSAP